MLVMEVKGGSERGVDGMVVHLLVRLDPWVKVQKLPSDPEARKQKVEEQEVQIKPEAQVEPEEEEEAMVELAELVQKEVQNGKCTVSALLNETHPEDIHILYKICIS